MPTEITGQATNPASVTAPSDGDPRTGASIQVLAQDLADQIKSGRVIMSLKNWIYGKSTVHNSLTGRVVSGLDPSVDGSQSIKGEAWLGLGSVIGGNSTIFFSRDGENSALLSSIGSFKPVELVDGIYEPVTGRWVLIGGADGVDAYILTHDQASDIAFNWQEGTNPQNFNLRGVAHNGAGVAVAAGSHDGVDLYCVRSADVSLAAWAEIAMVGVPGDQVNAMAWNGTNFVAVGVSGGGPLVLTSPDGLAPWTPRAVDGAATNTLVDVAYNGAATVAVGSAGEIHQSLDGGLTWALVVDPSVLPFNNTIRSIAADPAVGVFAITQDGVHGNVSFDDGATWSYLDNFPAPGGGSSAWQIGASPSGFLLWGIDPLSPTSKMMVRSLKV